MSGIALEIISFIYFVFVLIFSIIAIAGGGDGVMIGIVLLLIGLVSALVLYGFGMLIEKITKIDRTLDDIADMMSKPASGLQESEQNMPISEENLQNREDNL